MAWSALIPRLPAKSECSLSRRPCRYRWWFLARPFGGNARTRTPQQKPTIAFAARSEPVSKELLAAYLYRLSGFVLVWESVDLVFALFSYGVLIKRGATRNRHTPKPLLLILCCSLHSGLKALAHLPALRHRLRVLRICRLPLLRPLTLACALFCGVGSY